jgi:hypothetical protein
MAGTPFKALKEGSLQVAKTIFEAKEFEFFLPVFYDKSIYHIEPKNL